MTQPQPRFSRRYVLHALGGGVASMAFLACTESAANESPTVVINTVTPVPTSSPTPIPPTAVPTPVVSLEEKIGQMLMVGFYGPTMMPASPAYADIVTGRLGHVVLFDLAGNIESPGQLARLTSELHALAPQKMLIAVDQEGGAVARLGPNHGFPAMPSEQYLGSLNNPATTRQTVQLTAEILAKEEINLNLAPVVDVNVNPSNPVIGALGRSFSADPEVVATQALAFIEAHHAAGVFCTLKHFPGHGSSVADSHLGFVDVSQTWSRRELIPFQRVIQAGKADVVMTAHIFNANLDADYPATLSQKTITGVLRGELGYNGVIMTDDMQMGAIRQYFGFERAIELAIEAGADIISIANTTLYDPLVSSRAFEAIRTAVAEGRIEQRRIDQSYARIQSLKARLS